MSYRCQICGDQQPPKTPMRRHVVQRGVPTTKPNGSRAARLEIAREIPVCEECQQQLKHLPLATVIERRGSVRPDVPEPVVIEDMLEPTPMKRRSTPL